MKIEKETAIALRKQGKTYQEILAIVSVVKSTLSLWLREVKLSKSQSQHLTEKKRLSQLRGAASRKSKRIEETEVILALAKEDIPILSSRERFMIGVALYWAEGTKKSGTRTGMMVDFANSDPNMIRFFIAWLIEFGGVAKSDVTLRLHLHVDHKHRELQIKRQWLAQIGNPDIIFTNTLYKKHNPKTKRQNTGDLYMGLVSVRVQKSTRLQRRIMGWIYAIIATQNCQ